MYTLRFPFRLPADQTIGSGEDFAETSKAQYRLSKTGNWYVLSVDGFSSEDKARSAVADVWSGLKWVLLNANVAPSAVVELSEVIYCKDPNAAAKSFMANIKNPVDGIIDGAKPIVFLTEKKICTLMIGGATVTVGTPAARIFQLLEEHSFFKAPSKPLTDPKLQVGLDLYSAYFTETSANARFLTLVMALEALAFGTQRPKPILDLLTKWREQVEQIKQQLAEDGEILHELESLSRELLVRRENSIRNQIRSLVLTVLNSAGHSDAQATAETAVKIYDHRSTLVHDGSLDPKILSDATSKAKSIVERVLRSRFLAEAQAI